MQKLPFFLLLTFFFLEEATLAGAINGYNSSEDQIEVRVEISPSPSDMQFFPTTLQLKPGANTLPIHDIEANQTVKIYHNGELWCSYTYKKPSTKPKLTIAPGGQNCVLN